MNPHISLQIKNFTEQSAIRLPQGCESLLDILYYAYAEQLPGDSPQVKACIHQLDVLTKELPSQLQDDILTAALALSSVQDRQAYKDGIRTGICLFAELSHE